MAQISVARPEYAALSIFLATTCMLAVVTPVAAQDIEVLAKSEDRAPDDSGELFLLRTPVQRAGGKLAFTTILRENGLTVGSGVYRADPPGNVVQILREGDAASDGNGQIGSITDPDLLINEHGDVAFFNRLINTIGGTIDDTVIFIGDGTSAPAIVARSGQTPAGSPAPLNSPLGPPNGLNGSGQVLFTTKIAGGDRGLFIGDGTPGGLVQIALDGDTVPKGEEVQIAAPGAQPAALNEAGEVAFLARLIPIVPRTDAILIADGTNPLIEVVREGDPLPSGPGSFAELRTSPGLPASNHPLNDRGEVAFVAGLAGTAGGLADNAGLFLGDNSKITELVRRGDPAPDGNGTFLDFGLRIDLDEAGRVVFKASLSGVFNGATDGLFVADANGVRQILRRNDPAPGGGVFSDLLLGTGMLAGQVVFLAWVNLEDGLPTEDLRGLFFFDGLKVHSILRVGDSFPGLGEVTDLRLAVAQTNEGPEGNAIGNAKVGFQFTTAGSFRQAVWTHSIILADGFESGDASPGA